MIRHFAVHGYISCVHKQDIDRRGAVALKIAWVKDSPEKFSAGDMPAYRVEGSFDIDEAEISGIWRE